ncbi:MAG: Mur ligase family protein [Firmicutes bacterium]|nr:Mur ligase family protein [Bacillota bacterium]
MKLFNKIKTGNLFQKQDKLAKNEPLEEVTENAENTQITLKFMQNTFENFELNQTYKKAVFAKDATASDIAFILDENANAYIPQATEVEKIADLAIKNGATLLVHSQQIKNYPCLILPNVLDSFVALLEKFRNQFSPYTIGITGSVGKTTTTQMIYHTLQKNAPTNGHLNNGNALRNVAITMQNLQKSHKYYVQEIAESAKPTRESKITKPNMLIVTLVGTAHMGRFSSKEEVLAACLMPLKEMPPNGLLIMNADDKLQFNATVDNKVQKIFYSLDNPQSDFRATNIKPLTNGTKFDVSHNGEVIANLQINFFGKHNVYNALAAFVALKFARITIEQIKIGFSEYQAKGFRQNFLKIGNYNLFLDCFNASLESMQSMLENIPYLPPKQANGKNIAILADMAELGWYAEEAHKSVGELVAKSAIDILIFYGKFAKFIAETAINPNIEVHYAESFEQLTKLMHDKITPNDLTLIKGSRLMQLELAVDVVFGTSLSYSTSDLQAKTIHSNLYDIAVFPKYAKIIKYTAKDLRTKIPNQINGNLVRSVGRFAFFNSNILQVDFPDTISNIGYRSFLDCNSLTRVVLPKNLRILEESAFSRCQKLREVVMNDKVLEIHRRAFGNCTNLRQINIPPSCTVIGEEAFLNCEKLTIYGKIGSFAEEYARQNNIPFAEDNFPFVHAHCVCIMDNKTGEILYEKNADVQARLYSTVKIVTALIALEEGNLAEIVTIPEIIAEGGIIGLTTGEKISLEDLLYGLMLNSGNDAAEAIAIHFAGSREKFIVKMNTFAQNIGMLSYNLNSPSGMPVAGVFPTATATDIAILTKYALQNTVFKKIVNTPTYTCQSDKQQYIFEQTNALLHTKKDDPNKQYAPAFGVKTGYFIWKSSFVSAAEKDGNQHICVQLGITDGYQNPESIHYRFEDAITLHEWAFEKFKT